MTLTSWFDASALAQADGTVLNSWPDLSASNQPAVATAPRAPIVKTNIQNGKRGVLFDGIDDWMNWHPTPANIVSRFVAFKWVGPTAAGNGDPRIWEGYPDALMVHTATGALRVISFRSSTLGDYRTANNTIEAGKSYLVEYYRDRSNPSIPPEIWVNGVKVAVTTIAVESGILTGDSFSILGNSTSNVNGTRSINAYYLEARYFNTLLVDADKATNRSQMLSKWAIAGAIQAKNVAGSWATQGNVPELVLTKDTVHGIFNFSSSLGLIRGTAGTVKHQTIGSTISFVGTIPKRATRRKLVGSLGLVGVSVAQLTDLFSYKLEHTLALSGRLIPAVAGATDHMCRECLKRWAARIFGRSFK
jgi:hypothetical protein